MDTNSAHEKGGKNVCDCKHHKAIPILVILFAVTFLFRALGIFDDALTNVLWPIMVGIAGFFMLGDRKCGCC